MAGAKLRRRSSRRDRENVKISDEFAHSEVVLRFGRRNTNMRSDSAI
jgi:hypothetical protein